MARTTDGRASNGGARSGAGRLPTSIPLSGPAIIYLREITRQRTGRREVTQAHMGAVLEEIFMEWAQQQRHEPPTGPVES
jgi:hypothetical protein